MIILIKHKKVIVMKIIINNIEDTKRLANIIASFVKVGDVVCLNGDLGAGKTTFTKFFAEAIGIKEIVNSPTFNIIKCYFNKNINLYHIDAYRLEDNNFDMGLDEYIYGDGVCVIEWGKFIKDIIPDSNLTLDIKRVDETKREVEISGGSHLIKDVIEAWEEC